MNVYRGSVRSYLHSWSANFFIAVLSFLAVSAPAYAGSFGLGNGIEGQYKLTFNYSAAVRTGNADQNLINGPIDPFVAGAGPSCPDGQTACFGHTGLPTTANYDDGDRNFKKWSLINNRLSALGEIQFTTENYGLIFSGNAFYDHSYRGKNDNDSPNTVNIKNAPNNEFTAATNKYDGLRMRLLEAYVYGDWTLSDESSINVRVGKQVAAYGESLFLSGISSAQGPFDATKAFVAGSEIKDIILPENQIAIQMSLNNRTTLLAEYQLDFAPTDIFPQGDYFSPADVVGPGATFAYGSLNPAVAPCPGLLPGGLDAACQLNTQLGIAALVIDGPRTIDAVRGPDIMPSKYGHWGIGLKYQLTPITNIGIYRLRYADHNPTVKLNVGFAYVGTVRSCNNALNSTLTPLFGNQCTLNTGVTLDTNLNGVLRQYVPTSYNVKYVDGIDMTAIAYSTVLGPFNIGGEFSYRQGLDMPIKATISGVKSPVFTRGNLSQAQISALYTDNPRFIADDIVFVGEAGIVHVNSVQGVPSSPGIQTAGNGDQLFYSATSYGFQTLFLATTRNVLSGWDLTIPLSYGMIIKGNPSMSGAFGALYGEGDKRFSMGARMQYLQNLEVGVSYNFYFGDTSKTIGDSPLKANPYADRDYATVNVKYSM